MLKGVSNKIAVITLPGRFNYGNRLQNYAVTRIYTSMGLEVESLELMRRFNVVQSAKSFIKHLLGRVEPDPESLMCPERKEAFARFDMRMLTRVLSSIDPTLKDEYAWFSVGSDQVWNPSYIRHNEDWYFLKFARPEQRIAFSPSVGLDSLDSRQASRIRKGVAGFPQLSVRERDGADLIQKCSGREAAVTVDPTLVLSADEWRSVADGHLTPAEPYVFTYLLGGVSDSAAAALDIVLKNGMLRVVPLSDRSREGEPDAGPQEFISLIDKAQHVVTDSFHAAVFSMLMGTPLTIVRRGGTSMFSRLATLTSTFHLENRIYGSAAYDPDAGSEYAMANVELGFQRDKTVSYIEQCLGTGCTAPNVAASTSRDAC